MNSADDSDNESDGNVRPNNRDRLNDEDNGESSDSDIDAEPGTSGEIGPVTVNSCQISCNKWDRKCTSLIQQYLKFLGIF